MTAFQVKVGGFYVNDSKGLVREITREDDDGKVHWRSYYLSDGRPTGDSLMCEPGWITSWASREATPEEVATMRREDAHSGEMREALELARNVLTFVSDEQLFAEVRRRGRKVM